MPEEDYRLKRMSDAQEEFDSNPDVSDKLNNFQWSDDEDNTDDDMPSVPYSQQDIKECVHVLSSYLFQSLSEYFKGDIGDMGFVIPIDASSHELLQKRFEEDWNLESRVKMFEEINDQLIALLDDDSFAREKIADRIEEALPASDRKKFIFSGMRLLDDSLTVGDDSNMISIEVSLEFAANT